MADGEWKQIGYVLQKALNDINEVPKKQLIVDTRFNLVNYIISWKGPTLDGMLKLMLQ